MAPPVAAEVDGPVGTADARAKSGAQSVRSVVEKILYLNARKHVRQTMENHWDINDPDVADMVVHLARESRKEEKESPKKGDAVDTFCEKLESVGAETSRNTADILMGIVARIDGIIDRLAPSKSPRAAGVRKRANSSDNKDSAFPGLSIHNETTKDRPELKLDRPEERDGIAPLSATAEHLILEEMPYRERVKYEREKKRREHERSMDRKLEDYHRRDRRRSRTRSRSRSRDRRRRHDRSRSRSRDKRRGDSKRSSDLQPLELYTIHRGTVQRVMEYGCFVAFRTQEGEKEGLVHVGEILPASSAGRSRMSASDLVKRNQSVYVKIVGLAGTKISLSMREADQKTGEDLRPRNASSSKSIRPGDSAYHGANSIPIGGATTNAAARSGRGSQTGIRLDLDQGAGSSSSSSGRQAKQHLNDYELWEARQLRASGVLDASDMPDFDPRNREETKEEVELEVADAEPKFLAGQTAKTGVILSPVRIVKEPDGSLQRAAIQQSTLAQERRESKQAMQEQVIKAIPKDMSRPWEDPNPNQGERTLAQNLRSITMSSTAQNQNRKHGAPTGVSYGQRSALPMREQRESLPIFKLRSQLLQAMAENQVLIVIGETGSGKTTQMTQYMAEAGYADQGIIGCTQPRRVAAITVAKRVAEEYGCRLGQEVGYTIRFEDHTSPETRIKYMTDGMLLREALADPLLKKYSVIMLDEAHERTIHTDVLFGLCKEAIRQRNDLKLIVTSATLDAEKFSRYFFDSHIFTIPGRTFPVEILYSNEPEEDYVQAALMTVMQIHLTEQPGDILVFLTGQEEIDTACQLLDERMAQLAPMNPPPLIPMGVYAAQPSEVQSSIFEPAPAGSRKCVVATNIAEASITIDGIYFVVDPGFAKRSRRRLFNAKTQMDALIVTPISQANARQRAGRAGRTGPGKCYRLYTEKAFRTEMLPSAVPEIQRSNLSNVVLTLKAMGINDLLGFDFMDAPPVQTLINSLEALWQLGALDDEGLLTKLGRKMAEFPMPPEQSKMLLASVDLGCADEAITVVAMLSVQNVFYRPRDKQAVADQKKSKFNSPEGDHVTLLEVYKAWSRNRFSAPWCYENFIQVRSLRKAQDVRKQLIGIMDRYRLEINSCGQDYNRLRQAIAAGYFNNLCRRDPNEGYRVMRDLQQVYIHPSSALYQKNPEWVIYYELVMTTREYIREVCTVEPEWMPKIAPNMFKQADSRGISRMKASEKIEPLYSKYHDRDALRTLARRKC
ncbi:hypothetical protein FOZ60_011798 [Perkinsus olseni]|uniref:RNA helicase n=4 Tax=Perkinsus olseni TaxID=32597 RepID=A0A7J6PN23_PEROL|nr:hypothetical protein FOZ60_011798 [Perkinsus olseni]